MANCNVCKRMKLECVGLWFCDYKGTYYITSEVFDRSDIRCDGFDCIKFGETDETSTRLEIKQLMSLREVGGRSRAHASRQNCFCCGKPFVAPVEQIYCEECNDRETARDNESLEMMLDDPVSLKGLCSEMIASAISDYKSLLHRIMKEPQNKLLYADKYEMEDYFKSDDFQNIVEFAIDTGGELTKAQFEERADYLIEKMKRKVGYSDERFPAPERELYGM